MTHGDHAGDPPSRREAAGDVVHRQGFSTHSGGSQARPERRPANAFGQRRAHLAIPPHRHGARSLPKTLADRPHESLSALLGILLIFILTLGGCAGEPDVYALIQDRAYAPSEFRHAAANKPVRTVIAGNPFPKTTERAAHDAVLAAMQPVNWHQPLPFTPRTYFTDTPKGEHNPRYRVVVALNPDETKNGWKSAPCAEENTPPTLGPLDDHTVRMVFCRDEAPLSISHGTLNGNATPDDKRFRRMIARATMELFPQRRDNRNCLGLQRKGRC